MNATFFYKTFIYKKNRYLNINRINSVGSKIKSLNDNKNDKKYITSNKNSRERVVKKHTQRNALKDGITLTIGARRLLGRRGNRESQSRKGKGQVKREM